SARASDVQDPIRAGAGTDAPLFSWRAMVFSERWPLGPAAIARFASHGVLGLPVGASPWVAAVGWRTDAQWFAQAGVPVVWRVGVGRPRRALRQRRRVAHDQPAHGDPGRPRGGAGPRGPARHRQ